jgi:hypothetical protein
MTCLFVYLFICLFGGVSKAGEIRTVTAIVCQRPRCQLLGSNFSSMVQGI